VGKKNFVFNLSFSFRNEYKYSKLEVPNGCKHTFLRAIKINPGPNIDTNGIYFWERDLFFAEEKIPIENLFRIGIHGEGD